MYTFMLPSHTFHVRIKMHLFVHLQQEEVDDLLDIIIWMQTCIQK